MISLSTIRKSAEGAPLSVLFVPFLLVKLLTDTTARYRSRGVFSLNATWDIEGHFTGVARTERSGYRPTRIWSGAFGELRLETTSDDPGMIGDFSFRLVADNGSSSTRAAECTGRFDTNAPGARGTHGFPRFARRMWRTPVVQGAVFVPRLMYAIVGVFVLLVVFTVQQGGRGLRGKRSSSQCVADVVRTSAPGRESL